MKNSKEFLLLLSLIFFLTNCDFNNSHEKHLKELQKKATYAHAQFLNGEKECANVILTYKGDGISGQPDNLIGAIEFESSTVTFHISGTGTGYTYVKKDGVTKKLENAIFNVNPLTIHADGFGIITIDNHLCTFESEAKTQTDYDWSFPDEAQVEENGG